MALTNILREPRREITEALIGLAAVGAFFYADYAFATWFISLDPPETRVTVALTAAVMAISFLCSFLLIPIAFLIHILGEAICDAMENHNIRVRPRNRP